MHIRRCAHLLLEPREVPEFDLADLIRGGTGLRSTRRWIALAPHLGSEIEIDAAERELLGDIGYIEWVTLSQAETRHSRITIDALLGKGLLIGDGDECRGFRERDERLRSGHWHGLSAAFHVFVRWLDIDSSEALTQAGMRTVGDLVRKFGEPPPHCHERTTASERIRLGLPAHTDMAELMSRRVTCRNFDSSRTLTAECFAALMHRVAAAQEMLEAAPGATVLKKTSPSGGGLHPTEAYLLIQRVEGISPGLYHYHSGEHALEPIAFPQSDVDALSGLAHRCVAGQYWFANAHVLLIFASRFRRSFWKYRNHAKAYRALILDVGHLSQTLYLTATELGLGAFVTSAINEIEIEQAFGLDPIEEGPLAVCGFGWRGSERVTVEFDPARKVWPDSPAA